MPVEDIKISIKMLIHFKTLMPVEDIKISIKMPIHFKTQMLEMYGMIKLEMYGKIRLVTGWMTNIMAN